MAEFKFTEHLVSNQFRYCFGVGAADIAGNGRLDLLAADAILGLFWFENDGQGHFTRHVVSQSDSAWAALRNKIPGDPYVLFKGSRWLERFVIADMNGDGRPEIVIVDNMGDCLLWFECRGDPRVESSWVGHKIADGDLPSAYDVTAGDFNGDGKLEVAASAYRRGNQFAWYENRDGQWIKHLIEGNLGEAKTIRAADVNGDGRLDLVATAAKSNFVLWYENTGDPADISWKKHVIDVVFFPLHGQPVDMDGDGDVDLVMAVSGMETNLGIPSQIVWYENDGHPEKPFWKKHVICADFPGGFEAVAGDLDGDGQMEVVATAWGSGGRLAVFKHEGDPRGPWRMQVLKEPWQRANAVLLADVDGDGRLDIVASAEEDVNELRWWRNEGRA